MNPTHRVLPEDYHQPPDDLAYGYQDQLIETTRKWLALHKQFPDCLIRFRRAAPKRQKDNPNTKLALVFVKPLGEKPQVHVIEYAQIEREAKKVTDAEVFAEFDRRIGHVEVGEGEA